jgi:hypothetical protein
VKNCFLLDVFVVPTERITCGTNTRMNYSSCVQITLMIVMARKVRKQEDLWKLSVQLNVLEEILSSLPGRVEIENIEQDLLNSDSCMQYARLLPTDHCWIHYK